MSNENLKAGDGMDAVLRKGAGAGEGVQLKAHWSFVLRDADGNVKWTEEGLNLVTTEGLNTLLGRTFDAPGADANWFVGLKATGAPAAGDTMASHATWSEITDYDEATRPAYTLNASPSAGAISNSSSKASFAINATVSIFGGFLTSNSTKGGTTGLLFNAKNFAAQKDASSGDTLEVQVDISVA